MAGLPLIVITGPTGSGKSRVAPLVAQALNAEIICADSRQIYSGIPIGSASPTPDEMGAVPHHLFGSLAPSEDCSAGRYRDLAEAAIEGIRSRGRIPMLVGGTGLYIDAVAGTMGLAPQASMDVSAHFGERVRKEGPEPLWVELEKSDPVAASRIKKTDSFRIVRALSVIKETGNLFSSYSIPIQPRHAPVARVAISWPRTELYSRINMRCDQMVQAGLVEEARLLHDRRLNPALPAMRSIGYHHIFSMLEGVISPSEAFELMKRDSRRYAKRQLTWLRGRGTGTEWIEGGEPRETAERASKYLKSVLI